MIYCGIPKLSTESLIAAYRGLPRFIDLIAWSSALLSRYSSSFSSSLMVTLGNLFCTSSFVNVSTNSWCGSSRFVSVFFHAEKKASLVGCSARNLSAVSIFFGSIDLNSTVGVL